MDLGSLLPPGIAPVSVRSFEEYEQARCDIMNRERGSLPGEHCDICQDKGRAAERLRKSGLAGMLDAYTFASFEAGEPWQREMKAAAAAYAENPDGWFLLCGQTGCGKTHLCTAAVGRLMDAGRSARYMLWRDEAVKLKAAVNDEAAYAARMRPLKEADVLYIDDLFKTAAGARPTPGDIHVAFELINARYCRPQAVTLISCEATVEELLQIDEAVGSRIYQRTRGHCVVVRRSPSRNYRMRGAARPAAGGKEGAG